MCFCLTLQSTTNFDSASRLCAVQATQSLSILDDTLLERSALQSSRFGGDTSPLDLI